MHENVKLRKRANLVRATMASNNIQEYRCDRTSSRIGLYYSSNMQTMDESWMHRGATERKVNGSDRMTFSRILY